MQRMSLTLLSLMLLPFVVGLFTTLPLKYIVDEPSLSSESEEAFSDTAVP